MRAYGYGYSNIFGKSGGGSAAPAWSPSDWGSDRVAHYIASDVLTSGSLITAWVDQLGATNATQVTSTKQATLTTSANLNGKPVGSFDGSNDLYTCTLTDASTANSWCFVRDATGTAAGGATQCLASTTTGRMMVLSTHSGPPGVLDPVAYVDLSSAAQLTAAGSEIYDITSGGTLSLYRGGSLLDSVSITNTAIGGTFGLGASYAATIPALDKIAEFVLLNRATSSDDRTNWFAYTSAEYGV